MNFIMLLMRKMRIDHCHSLIKSESLLKILEGVSTLLGLRCLLFEKNPFQRDVRGREVTLLLLISRNFYISHS